MTPKPANPPLTDAVVTLLPSIIEQAREAAREHGYAIAIHGSLRRDIDLIAAPWVEDASPAEVLVEAVRQAVHGFIVDADLPESGARVERNPEQKPHGRLAWAIHLVGYGTWIDLSVMPRLQ